MKEKVVFFGSSKFVIPILEVLRKNFDLSLVLTTENPKDRKPNLALQGDALQSYAVVKYCVENKIPYLSLQQFNNSTIKRLKEIKSPVAVLADFGLIIPRQILNVFPKGIINIHPSLLPKYRGPTPTQTAILNGEKITGVSIIKLDEEIDHGPILVQQKEEILDNDTSESLYQRLFEKGANLLFKVLPHYLEGNLNHIAQNHKEATFTKPLTRQDGYLEVSNALTAVTKIDTMIRAYYPWPGVWSKIRIKNPYSSEASRGRQELRIKFLPDQKIQVEGKKPVDIETFKRGYPETRQWLEKLFGQQE